MRPRASSSTCCNVGSDACACQPAYALPSYSMPTAILILRVAPRKFPGGLGERLHEALRFLLLRSGAFVEHLFENVARAIWIAHVHVGTCEVELGSNLALGHRLQIRQGQFLGREPLRG